MGVTTCTNWHMSDVECNSIHSCDCGADDEDSPKTLLSLSSTNMLNQMMILRKFIFKILHYVYIILSLGHILCILLLFYKFNLM